MAPFAPITQNSLEEQLHQHWDYRTLFFPRLHLTIGFPPVRKRDLISQSTDKVSLATSFCLPVLQRGI